MDWHLTFAKLEITAVENDHSSALLEEMLTGLYATVKSYQLAHAAAFGGQIIHVKKAGADAAGGGRLIRSVKAEVWAGAHLDDAMAVADFLSEAFDYAPVGFEFAGKMITVVNNSPAEAARLIKNTVLKIRDQNLCDRFVVVHIVNGDEHSAAAMELASRWGKLMQHEMEVKGKVLPEIAAKTLQLAKFDGIDMEVYEVAVSVLSQTWVYGEQLQAWYNKTYGRPARGMGRRSVVPEVAFPGCGPRG